MSPSPKKILENPKQSDCPTFILSVTNTDISFAPTSRPSPDVPKSQCSSLSDGESFECFGENGAPDSSDVELVLAPQNTIMNNGSGRRQLGSNALASHLYRSSSSISSGRNSNCDNTEEMYSDVSSEDVQDLNHKLELLQKQVTNLADTQNIVENRTTRTKTEYAVLQARYHMLEEQLRESELRSDERFTEEQKRHREILARVEREAQLQNENYQIRIKAIQLESNCLKEEVQRIRIQCDKQAADLHLAEEKYDISHENLIQLQEEIVGLKTNEKILLQEKKETEELVFEFNKEIERLRVENGPGLPTTSPEVLRLEELHNQLEELRLKNKKLEEVNVELQAIVLTKGIEEGRHLLNGTSHSLAQELQEMSHSQDDEDSAILTSLSQLQMAYHEKEEENHRLKHYIDTILLNIVENYPQLLEVRPANTTTSNQSFSKQKR